MIQTVRSFLFFLILITYCKVFAAETPRTIMWDDLLPDLAPLSDPFKALSRMQLLDLEVLISADKLKKQGKISDVDRISEEAIEIGHKLKSQGLNIAKLMDNFKNWEREIMRRDQIANKKLDGIVVRIPGYALPLEHRNSGVKELLLVPYVGACIHVPPPPPNQTIYVKLRDTYIVQNLYDPVWITGRLSITKINKSLSFVDGSAGVKMAYILDGVTVIPYSE